MVQACLNGGLTREGHRQVPVTVSEIAADAKSVRDVGADEIHVHARDEQGLETLAPEFVASVVVAIRSTVPGMKFGLGTGAWTKPGGRLRHAHLANWTVVPDYVSVNIGEEDAFEVIELMLGHGVSIEAGVWSVDDAYRLVNGLRPENVHRVLIEMITQDPITALSTAEEVLRVLRVAGWQLPILLHGEEASAWPCLREAAARGFDARIGLEDTVHLEDGTLTEDNSQLVKAALRIFDEVQRP